MCKLPQFGTASTRHTFYDDPPVFSVIPEGPGVRERALKMPGCHVPNSLICGWWRSGENVQTSPIRHRLNQAHFLRRPPGIFGYSRRTWCEGTRIKNARVPCAEFVDLWVVAKWGKCANFPNSAPPQPGTLSTTTPRYFRLFPKDLV